MSSNGGLHNETEDLIRARHRREAKELGGKTTALKKSVGKGAATAQKKKEVMDEIARLEHDMDARHQAEMRAFQAIPKEARGSSHADLESRMDGLHVTGPSTTPAAAPLDEVPKPKKPNRQQLRKERKKAQLEEDRQRALEEAANVPNMRAVEDDAISKLLEPFGLAIKHIIPDGHCLYNAISDQMSWRSDEPPIPSSEMRRLAASYMRKNGDQFMPFLVNDDGDIMTQDQFQKYCNDIEQTPMWGGQLEIQAISKALSRPIHVIQMNQPVLKIGDDAASQEPLIIS
ncbi:hypothetical protein SeLEV6574_g01447 [Synchytrium endobioticum]|nr:hypothetical protein SeLEV6574_g01447 [Synchytrium endobioticum]